MKKNFIENVENIGNSSNDNLKNLYKEYIDEIVGLTQNINIPTINDIESRLHKLNIATKKQNAELTSKLLNLIDEEDLIN